MDAQEPVRPQYKVGIDMFGAEMKRNSGLTWKDDEEGSSENKKYAETVRKKRKSKDKGSRGKGAVTGGGMGSHLFKPSRTLRAQQ